ncbi:hypothetical protein EYW49_20480 [Siculibacillus lacustris]|uniref:Uncharacterized protein n=1 Tax=Siculibacillus lacustris TaxID=1549641 RepID=A0A4Q9VET9_9HYPH|nr:hypothetical protein [Siculibacillus lacustris]TBW33338.1 hypothetical protein EYW49_20480 [Siculibacillus lacustris]
MNITLEMVGAFVAICGVIAVVAGIFIARFGKVDDRCASIEKDLAASKLKAAESYVTITALASFDERLARTEERVLAETRSLRSDLQSVLSRPIRRSRVALAEGGDD